MYRIHEAFRMGHIPPEHARQIMDRLQQELRYYTDSRVGYGGANGYAGSYYGQPMDMLTANVMPPDDRVFKEEQKAKQTKKEKAEKLRSLIAHYYHKSK